MKEGIAIISTAMLLFFGIIFWNDIKAMFSGNEKKTMEEKSKKSKKDKEDKGTEAASYASAEDQGSSDIRIIERWELPKDLKEISGITYLGNNKFACVQDEEGTVFIYDLASERIERQIAFSGPGDFEGIALVSNTIYVVRADGRLFEINDFRAAKPAVKGYASGLSLKNNVESLCYDKERGRLLLTGKDKDPEDPNQKRIYSFDLATKKMAGAPVATINLTNELLGGGKKALQPSAIGVHPVTSNILIVDGPSAKLVVVDPDGKVRATHALDNKQLPQAEGISFSENGEVYLSTEGKDVGAIVKVDGVR